MRTASSLDLEVLEAHVLAWRVGARLALAHATAFGDMAERPIQKRANWKKAVSVLDDSQHALCVDTWLERSATDLAPEALLRLLEAALDAVWIRTKTTLGEVTLTAIAERVLHNASERHSLLWSLKIESTRGIQCRELGDRIGSVEPAELRQAIRFVLVELLTVLGNLTADILTPALHAEISRVALADVAPFGKKPVHLAAEPGTLENEEEQSWRK